jgi:hypothetical protein
LRSPCCSSRCLGLYGPQILQQKFNEQIHVIQQLSLENKQLHEKVKYLEDTIRKLVQEKIQEKKSQINNESYTEKRIYLSQTQSIVSNNI